MLRSVGSDLFGGGEQLGIARGAVRLSEAVERPGLGARPHRIRRESLVRVSEHHLARRGMIRENEQASAGSEGLAIVSGAGAQAVEGAAAGAHQPLSALEGVFAAELQPLEI